MNKKVLIPVVLIVAAAIGAYLYNAETKSLFSNQTQTLNLLILPRSRNVGNPIGMIVNKHTFSKDFIEKLENSLSDEKTKVKVEVNFDYAWEDRDYADLKGKFVLATRLSVYRMERRNARLDPMQAIVVDSAYPNNPCIENGSFIVKKESALSKIEDLVGKKIGVEGRIDMPTAIFNEVTETLHKTSPAIFSEIRFNQKSDVLLEWLKKDIVDVLFVDNIQMTADDLHKFTLLGEIKQNSIGNDESLKAINSTSHNLLCGVVMASSVGITAEQKADMNALLTNFAKKDENKKFLKSSLGFESFFQINAADWEKNFQFVKTHDVDNATAKLIATKYKEAK